MTPDTDRPADMPPWIVEEFSAGRIYVAVYSDGDVILEEHLLPRDEAIAMCRRILAILEGDQPTPITWGPVTPLVPPGLRGPGVVPRMLAHAGLFFTARGE